MPDRSKDTHDNDQRPPAPPTVHFQGFDCVIEQTTYANGRTALILVNPQDREDLVAVATVNLPDVPLKPGEVFIKDYSENQGMLAALEKAGIVQATGQTVQSGFAEVSVAKLLPPGYQREERGPVQAPAGTREQTSNQPPSNAQEGPDLEHRLNGLRHELNGRDDHDHSRGR